MRKLIILRGLHHFDQENKGPRDWRKCYDSLKENYLDFAGSVDCILQTYSSPVQDDMLRSYNPLKSIIYPLSTVHAHNQLENVYTAMSALDDPMQYDEILLTRFDVLYTMKYPEWTIDRDKFNFFFRQPNGTTNDVACVIPPHLFEPFRRRLRGKRGVDLHGIVHPDRDDVSFMTSELWYSDTDYPEYFPQNGNPFYTLHRVRRWGFQDAAGARREAERQQATCRRLGAYLQTRTINRLHTHTPVKRYASSTADQFQFRRQGRASSPRATPGAR